MITPKLKHLWWFAKKDLIIVVSMKSSGELVELNLDHCVALFGDDPLNRVIREFQLHMLIILRSYNI